MLTAGDLALLACPVCHGSLRTTGAGVAAPSRSAPLSCTACHATWPVEDGLARLYCEQLVRGTDRLMRVLYDTLPSLHDAAVRWSLPLMDAGEEDELRNRYLDRMDLSSLHPTGGEPARILDVGIGTGAGLDLMLRRLPADLPVEIWGLDLSLGMLRRCITRVESGRIPAVRLLMADAHALPFRDATFDRVLHVGAINGYRDPRRALAEMARVARPGTPILVVDEQLDRSRPSSLAQRAVFRLVTFYDRAPHSPIEQLPQSATAIVSEQLGRYFYCLSFRMPGSPLR